MNWAVITYLTTGGLSLLCHGITFQALSHRSGGYGDMGLIVVIIPTFVINGIWGLTFPFIFNQVLDPNLLPIIRWILLLGSGLMHSLCGVASVWINAILAEARWKSR